MRISMAMTEATFGDLSSRPGGVESAGVGFARIARNDSGLTLVLRGIRWLNDAAYLERTATEMLISTAHIVRLLRDPGFAKCVPVFVHTHPTGTVSFSDKDDLVDAALAPLFMGRSRMDVYASVVVAGTGHDARLVARVLSEGQHHEVEHFRIVGQRLRIVEHQARRDEGAEMFERQVLAFGSAGQEVLRAMHIGVVGAGGTGSAVFEQLVRLGVGRITVIDNDALSASNVTRVHEVGVADAGTAKVELMKQAAERIGLGTSVNAVEAPLTSKSTLAELTQCDAVFGCTDDNFGRAILSRLAFWYMIPVFDMGFKIVSTNGAISGLYGRVTVCGPGLPCLHCRRRIDLAQMQSEALSPDERASRVLEGYAVELGDEEPAVGIFTTQVACLAINEMLARLFGYGEGDPPSELLLLPHTRRIQRLAPPSPREHYCNDPAILGRADDDPMLGMGWAS